MIISFDLDGVLFVDPVKFEIEPVPNFPFRLYYPERLRKGTVDLIHRLKEQDIRVWVYTSTCRHTRLLSRGRVQQPSISMWSLRKAKKRTGR